MRVFPLCRRPASGVAAATVLGTTVVAAITLGLAAGCTAPTGKAAAPSTVASAKPAPTNPEAPALAPGQAARPGRLLHHDDFRAGLAQWVVEQQPGGTVEATDGQLVIADAGGCTVWLRAPLTAPVVITYVARASSAARVSDLNCFWMASDPARPADLFAAGHLRDGSFATYDRLQTYYVGYGGNANTTTRFRRYDGTGARPLAPEHDRQASPFLLVPDHPYRITLIAAAGRVQFIRDGEVIFDVTDPAPLTRGWFGFRTVSSRLEISEFRVYAGAE